MKVITINVPIKYLDAIEILKNTGKYASRSEALRTALREFLMDEIDFLEALEDNDSFLTWKEV